MDIITARTNYLNIETVDGVSEYDLGSFSKGDFNFGPEYTLVVREKDIGRPDILSYRAYGTQNYWWFLMWYNGITDIWNDLASEMILVYPDVYYVREFLKQRMRKTKDNRTNTKQDIV